MFLRKGKSFYLGDLLCGLKQLDPNGGWFKHSPQTGWDIDTPPVEQCNKIYLQDDLTFKNNKVLELEKYIDHYKQDISKITFYTWHKGLHKSYPTLKIKWHPFFLQQHLDDAVKHKDELEQAFNLENKTNKFLCLNRNIRQHRDIIYKKLKDNSNCLITYKQRGINSPLENDWSLLDYRDWHNNNKEYLTNTKNLLVASELYNQCCFSLVTETRTTLPFDFVTEKTTQCFIALHPALYVSNKDHVDILRDWGFDLFDDIFDHSYDKVDDNKMRIDKLLYDNRDVLHTGISINDDIKKRLLSNREHYFTKYINHLQ